MKINQLVRESFNSHREHLLYLLVLVNCAGFIAYVALAFNLSASLFLSSLIAILLPGIFFLFGLSQYRQAYYQEMTLGSLSIVVGIAYTVAFALLMLNKNSADFQLKLDEVLILGGLCSFTKDHVLELLKVRSFKAQVQ